MTDEGFIHEVKRQIRKWRTQGYGPTETLEKIEDTIYLYERNKSEKLS